MADATQTAGWWLASDGRRYPPHLHPSVRQPAFPPPDPATQVVGNYPPGYGPPPGAALASGYVLAPGYFLPAQTSGPTTVLDPVLAQPLAPWWKRLMAVVIDGFVIAVPYFVILVIIGTVANRNTTTSPYNTTSPSSPGAVFGGVVAGFILVAIPYVLYAGLMSGSRRGQTLGKMAMSIAVRDARTGGPIGFGRGVGRYTIAMALELCAVIPFVLDSLSPLWDSRRQSWHDKVVHSVVIDLQP